MQTIKQGYSLVQLHFPTSHSCPMLCSFSPWFNPAFPQWNPSFPDFSQKSSPKKITGWWLTYPSEKYAQVSWDDDSSQYMESHKIPWFQPPTRWYDYYPNIYFTTFPHRFSQSLQCILHPEMESSIFSHLFTNFPLKKWQMIWLWRIWYEYLMSYQISWILLSQHGYGSKPWYPCSSHQNSWDLWMFIPLKMVLIGIDPYPTCFTNLFPTQPPPASAAPRFPAPPSPPPPTTSSPWQTAPGRAARRWPCDHWTPRRVAPCGDGGHGWNVFKMVKHMVNISGG